MTRILCIACTICLAATLAFAQQAQPATAAPASKDEVEHLFAVMHVRKQMGLVIDSVVKQQTAILHETMKKRFPNISQEELGRFDRVMSESAKDMPIDGMLQDMVPIYQKYLSSQDVKAMTAFYASPTGQKLMDQMPAMTGEAMQASQSRLQAQMEKTMQRIDEMLRDEPPAAPAKTPAQPK